MAPKPLGRPSAKDISDLDMLSAIEVYTRVGAPFPTDQFITRFPKNLVAAKLAKLERRGWITVKRQITKAGNEALGALINEATE